jgi:exosortase H (IPTLxxWG-CTERM-specific)
MVEQPRQSHEISHRHRFRRRRKLRVEVRFGLLFVASFALLYWLLMGTHGGATQWNVEDLMTRSVVWVSGQILALLGVAAQVEGAVLRTSGFGVRVLSGCNGMEAIIMYAAAVLAYPASWRAKGVAFLVGLPAIQVVNVARILGLLMVGQYWPAFFHDAHVFVAQGVMICLVAALWFWWIDRYGSPLAP